MLEVDLYKTIRGKQSEIIGKPTGFLDYDSTLTLTKRAPSKMRRTAKKILFVRTGFFLSKPTGLAYHHASACISSKAARRLCISSHLQVCISIALI